MHAKIKLQIIYNLWFIPLFLWPQTLTSYFRLNYAQLWMSILRGDEAGIKQHSKAMNCEELYGLFSCMVSGRAWSSITSQKLEKGLHDPNDAKSEVMLYHVNQMCVIIHE